MNPRQRVGLCLLVAALAIVAAACGSTAETIRTQPAANGSGRSLQQIVDEPQPGDQILTQEEEDADPPEPTAADLAHARNFLRKQDLPDEPLPINAVETQIHLGLCQESSGLEVADREAAVETGYFIFWVGQDPERSLLSRRAFEACLQGLETLSAKFPDNTRNHKKARYDLRVTEYQCLVEHGYPTSKPPPPGHFFQNPQMWTPWEELTGMPFGAPDPDERTLSSDEFREYAEALELCPRLLID